MRYKIILLLVVIGSIALYATQRSDYESKKDRYEKQIKDYRDSLRASEQRQQLLMTQIDSLELLKSKIDTVELTVKERYKDEKIFVADATILQLDSIIRSNSGIGR